MKRKATSDPPPPSYTRKADVHTRIRESEGIAGGSQTVNGPIPAEDSSSGDEIQSLTEHSESSTSNATLRLVDSHSMAAEAKVRGDGLVDIRIDSSLHRISAILSTMQDQGFEAEDYYDSPVTEKTPQDDSVSGFPILNIVMQAVGSQGDVQPFIAIGKALQERGHRVRLATHGVFRSLVESNGIEFFDIGGDPAELMAYMVKNPGLLPSYESAAKGELRRKRKIVRGLMDRCWLSCFARDEDHTQDGGKMRQVDPKPFVANAIIANPPSFAHLHCAQKLGVPLHMVFTMPWSATRAFSHPLANIRSTNLGETMSNYCSYILVDMLIWQGLKKEINAFRTRTLGLEPINSSWGPLMLQRLKIPITYCWSPSMVPKPRDWARHITVAGFCAQHNFPDYSPPEDLVDFIESGPSPIYVGFGSIVVDNPQALTALIFEAIKLTNVRAVVTRGWSGVGDYIPRGSNVFLVDSCPHQWLFEHVSCVVHHGGAGTTAAGLTAGKPTVVVPFFGDQFFWAQMISRVGAGPHAVPYKELTAEKLADAIQNALSRECIKTAEMLSAKLRAEDGALGVSMSFHRSIPLEALRCSLDSRRAAAWRYRRKKSKLQISAFAATVLRKQGLIDFKHIEPFRSAEYRIDQGPLEPFGSAVTSLTSVLYNTVKGLGVMTTEIDHIATHISMLGQKESGTAINYSSQGSNKADPALRSSKVGKASVDGAGMILKACVRSPMSVTMALAQGAHNMPRLWKDRTVREQGEITGVGTGLALGMKECFLGTYDGVAGLVTQPYIGARDDGVVGALKGVGKGLVGGPFKLLAAMAAPIAYPLKGLDVQMSKAFARQRRDPVVMVLIEQGEREYAGASSAERQAIVEQWQTVELL